MEEMYGELGIPVDRAVAKRAFRELLADARLGWVYLLELDGETAGYLAVTLGFSMMFGGRDAFVDDLFVRPAFRDRRLGSRALLMLHDEADAAGIEAIHLLVADTNPRAESLYRRLGFTTLPYRMMVQRLTPGSNS
jgi:ribosomal protein S18 acetylase RimI-like enzyme